jgi:hypothetical protein
MGEGAVSKVKPRKKAGMGTKAVLIPAFSV